MYASAALPSFVTLATPDKDPFDAWSVHGTLFQIGKFQGICTLAVNRFLLRCVSDRLRIEAWEELGMRVAL